MANDNSRNPPPQLEIGSVVKFKRKRNVESYQGTVSSFNTESSGFMLRNVTRGTEILPADHLFYFRLWEIMDFQVIQSAAQNLGNTTTTQTDHNVNMGEASSSSSTMLADDGQRGIARNRDSTTDTQTDQNVNVGEASSSSSTMLADNGQRGIARNRDSTTDTQDDDNTDGSEASKKARHDH